MSSYLPAEALASFPATYDLLPFRTAHVYDEKGNREILPMNDASFWKKHALGLYARKDLPAVVLTARDSFVTEQLRNSEHFMELVQLDGGSTPPGFSVLGMVGYGTDTLDSSSYVDDRGEGKFFYDSDHLSPAQLNSDGDGIVTIASSTLPAALATKAIMFRTKTNHNALVTDEGVRKRVVEFLTSPMSSPKLLSH